MQDRLLLLVIGLVGFVGVMSIGVIASQGLLPVPNEGETEEILRADSEREEREGREYEAEFYEMEAKEGSIRALVYADERVQEYLNGTYGESDLTHAKYTKSGNDELWIYVVGKRLPVEGDWRTSYNMTYTGIFELKVSVKDGQVVSIEKFPKEDKTYIRTFEEIKKKIIEKAFANPDIAAAIDGKEDIIVHPVRFVSFGEGSGCPPGSCVSIMLEQQSKGEILHFFYNPSKDKVFQLSMGEDW